MSMSTAAPDTTPVRNVKGAGKKSTQAKRQLYANPLPVGRASTRKTSAEPLSWWDRFNEWTKWLYDGTSPGPVYKTWYDDVTKSVWMYDTGDAIQLWTHGFFGKGNLSRSEPTWVARKQAEFTARERGELTAEQMTQKRREERKLLKIERARAAVKAGIQLPDGIAALGGEPDPELSVRSGEPGAENTPLWRGDENIPEIQAGVARVKGLKYFSSEVSQNDKSRALVNSNPDVVDDPSELEGIEHFQLTMVEAFFLAGMLGCLEVHDGNDQVCTYKRLTCLGFVCRSSISTLSFVPVTSKCGVSVTKQIRLEPAGQPLLTILHCLSSFPQSGLGGQEWIQVLRGLPFVQAWTSFQSCRIRCSGYS